MQMGTDIVSFLEGMIAGAFLFFVITYFAVIAIRERCQNEKTITSGQF